MPPGLLDIVAPPLPQPDEAKQRLRPFAQRLAWHSIQHAVQFHVLVRREFVVQAGVLEHDAEGAADGHGFAHRVVAGDPDLPRGRREDGGQDLDRRRLAGAVWAEERPDRALGDAEGDAVHGLERAECLRQVVDFDHRRHRGWVLCTQLSLSPRLREGPGEGNACGTLHPPLTPPASAGEGKRNGRDFAGPVNCANPSSLDERSKRATTKACRNFPPPSPGLPARPSPRASRAALVTGGARRIGRTIAIALAQAGFDVAVHCNASREAGAVTCEDIRRLGRRATLLPADLMQRGADPGAAAAGHRGARPDRRAGEQRQPVRAR